MADDMSRLERTVQLIWGENTLETLLFTEHQYLFKGHFCLHIFQRESLRSTQTTPPWKRRQSGSLNVHKSETKDYDAPTLWEACYPHWSGHPRRNRNQGKLKESPLTEGSVLLHFMESLQTKIWAWGIHGNSSSCLNLRAYLIFVTDTTDNVRVKNAVIIVP